MMDDTRPTFFAPVPHILSGKDCSHMPFPFVVLDAEERPDIVRYFLALEARQPGISREKPGASAMVEPVAEGTHVAFTFDCREPAPCRFSVVFSLENAEDRELLDQVLAADGYVALTACWDEDGTDRVSRQWSARQVPVDRLRAILGR
jgi:hypothetical protein